jgi:pyruvate/oxaloacetate carboxyltransferase
MRFLAEDPWERLRTIRKSVKKTKLQMLLRGQNLVGYRHYADDVVDRFVELAPKTASIFSAFSMRSTTSEHGARDCGRRETASTCRHDFLHAFPLHTEDAFVAFANELKKLGCHSICIKDMAGLLDPAACTSLVTRLRKEVDLPCRCTRIAPRGWRR